MNIESSYSNIEDPKLQAVFMNYFSVLKFNVDRVSSYFAEFSANCIDLNFCALGFTETWLTEGTEPLYLLDSYNPFFKSRCVKEGGGVALMIEEHLNAVIVEVLT